MKITILALLTAILTALPALAEELYVAPNGNDAWSGHRPAPNWRGTDGPFASLERARDELRRTTRSPGPVTVFVLDGRYFVDQPFKLEPADSGTDSAPIVYRAYQRENPVFTGGMRLTGFHLISNPAIRNRLPKEVRDKVLEVDLQANGVPSPPPLWLNGFANGRGFTPHPVMELFFDGRPLPLARWPNEGYTRVARVPTNQVSSATHGPSVGPIVKFLYDGDRPRRWANDKDILLYGYWCNGWADSYERIASIDPAKREITLAPPYARYGYRAGQPFHALNALSELDSPGEWYLDRASDMLYLYPPSAPERATVELSVVPFPLVEMNNVSNVTFQGFTWELGTTDGVVINGGSHCLLAGNTIRSFAGDGVVIHNGFDHTVKSCDIYSMGRGGIVLRGGYRKTLTEGRHSVENCDIHSLSRLDHTYTPAILIEGVGNRVSHNLLHDIPSSAIRLAGNDHLVEFNEICHVVTESDDQGGLDCWGDPTYRGNRIQFNYWHHIGKWRTSTPQDACGQAGIRLDDAISGMFICGNVFYRCSGSRNGFGGVQIHGGKDNTLINNLFVDCATAISLSTWGDKRWHDFAAAALRSPEIDPALYLTRYPELAQLCTQHDANLFSGNLAYHCGQFLGRDKGWNTVTNNVTTARDPGFTDAVHGCFDLAHVPAELEAKGWKPIPFERIGLYRDEFRRTWPARLIREMRAE